MTKFTMAYTRKDKDLRPRAQVCHLPARGEGRGRKPPAWRPKPSRGGARALFLPLHPPGLRADRREGDWEL